MGFINEDELLYKIGEVIMIETEEIKDIKYSGKGTIILFTYSGKKYTLVLSEINDNQFNFLC